MKALKDNTVLEMALFADEQLPWKETEGDLSFRLKVRPGIVCQGERTV